MKRRRLILVLVAIPVLAIAVFLLRKPVLRAAGWALVAEDPVGPADIIVVPSWDEESGALEAADLFHSGVAAHVAVLQGPVGPAEQELARRGVLPVSEFAWISKLLRDLGVSEVEGIPDVTGTESEGQVLSDWSRQRQLRSLIVVSQPDHSRRLRRVLHRSMKGMATTVMVRVARYSDFDPDHWWESRDGIRTEIEESEKLILDVVRHPIDW